MGETAYVTIKGRREGIARPEFEYEIPVAEAEEMLGTLCRKPLLEKTRYSVRHAGLVWEIDVFGGAAAGLVVAEVELASRDQSVALPHWARWEVTDDARYRNSAIVGECPPIHLGATGTGQAHRLERQPLVG